MIIRRKTVGGKRLSDRVPAITDKALYSASAFLLGVETFCQTDLAGIVELESFGPMQPDCFVEISPERAAYLFKLIVRLSGEDGRAFIAISLTADAMLIMFKLSYGLPELSEIEEIREAGLTAGFNIRVGEGAIFAETEVKRSDAALSATSPRDFLSTLISVFYC